MRRSLLVVLVVLLGVGIWVLRAQTMTVHAEVPDDSSLEVVVLADARTAGEPIEQLARAHTEVCVAESVPGATVAAFEATQHPDEHELRPAGRVEAYRIELQPGADAPDRDQLHGCLEDLRVRHLRLEVEAMTQREGDRVIDRET